MTGSTQTVALSGTGAGVPQVTLSPTSLTFPSEAVGSAEAMSVLLTNSGSGPLTVASIVVSGTNATDFLEFDMCDGTVASGASCEIILYFVPKGVGARTATITVTDNAGNVANTKQTIAVTGTATGTPTATLSGTAMTFATTKVGALSAGQSITLTNTGNAPLTVASVALSGTNPGDFMQFNTCTNIPAGDNCVLAVFFIPTATGARAATVTFTDNSGGTAGAKQTVTLKGTGN